MGQNRPTLEEQVANAHAQRERDAAFVASIDAEEERRAEVKRKAAAQAELEALATKRLDEWTTAGGTVEEFRRVWPDMMREHFGRRHAAEDAERQKMIDAQRIF